MPIDKISSGLYGGTGLSPAHVPHFWLKFDEMVDGINTVDYTTSRLVPVSSVDDFPDADDDGVRQLFDSTAYLVSGNLDLGDTYLRPGVGSSVIGYTPGPCGLSNSRNDYLVRGSCGIRDLQLSCPGGTAYHADTASTAFLGNVVITGSVTAIEVEDCSRLIIDRVFSGGNGRCVVISGNVPSGTILSIQGGVGAQANFRGVVIEGTAVIGPLTIQDNQWTLSDASNAAFEFSSSATYPASGNVLVQNNNLVLTNGALALTGDIDKTDPRFYFDGNAGIVDSAYMGSMGYDGNTGQNTTISASSTFFPVGNGNASHPLFTLSAESERFTAQGSGSPLNGWGVELMTTALKWL